MEDNFTAVQILKTCALCEGEGMDLEGFAAVEPCKICAKMFDDLSYANKETEDIGTFPRGYVYTSSQIGAAIHSFQSILGPSYSLEPAFLWKVRETELFNIRVKRVPLVKSASKT